MTEKPEKPNEWHLKFLIEEDPAAELRFRHIVKTFQEDLHVAEVEVSNSASEPTLFGIIVRFRDGKTQPANRALHHLDKIHATSPLIRRSRYEHLMSEGDPFGDDDEKSRS